MSNNFFPNKIQKNKIFLICSFAFRVFVNYHWHLFFKKVI